MIERKTHHMRLINFGNKGTIQNSKMKCVRRHTELRCFRRHRYFYLKELRLWRDISLKDTNQSHKHQLIINRPEVLSFVRHVGWIEWITVKLKDGTKLTHSAVFAADDMIKTLYKHLAD